MKLLDRKYVFANVADCRHDNFGSFYVSLPELPVGESLYNRMYIKKLIMPYDWRRVESGRDTLTVNGSVKYLTIGNPNILDLVDELNSIQTTFSVKFNRITSRLSFTNTTNGSKTLSTTANALLGMSTATQTVSSGETYTCEDMVDVRPTPIIEIRVDVGTAGQEVYDGGQIKNTGVLAAILMNVPLYSHKLWIDENGLYWADVSNENKEIRLTITDTDGNLIVPQTSPYFVIGLDTYRDDEREILKTQQEALKLQQYAMILSHAASEPIPIPPQPLENPEQSGYENYQLTGADLGRQL